MGENDGMLRDQAYARLRESFFSGAIKPGQLVSQRELANLIDCPLGPTREAIQRMAAEAILTVIPQRGIVITDLSVDFIKDVYELRRMIECEAVMRFFATDNRAIVDNLVEQHRAIIAAADEGEPRSILDRALRIDWHFHDTIVTSLDNKLVSDIYKANSDRIRMIQASRGYRVERLMPAMREHLAILELGSQRQPQAAAAAMQDHLEKSWRWAVLSRTGG